MTNSDAGLQWSLGICNPSSEVSIYLTGSAVSMPESNLEALMDNCQTRIAMPYTDEVMDRYLKIKKSHEITS